MESISKTPIDHRIAEHIVRDAFGSAVELAELSEYTEGWFNAVYRMDLRDGRSFVVKIAPPPEVEVLTYERDLLHAELTAMQLVSTRTTATVPEVVWVDERCRHVSSPLYVMTHVPGTSLWAERARLDPEARARIDATIGRHLREIHSITNPDFGLLAPGAGRSRSWRAAFGGIFEAVLDDGERKSVDLPIAYASARECVDACAESLDEVTEPRLVLWDLWDGNVLVDPDTFEINGFIDLERALWGDPLLETQFHPDACSPAFLRGYGDDGMTDRAGRQRRALYTLYLHLVMSIEGAYRRYPADPIGDYARARLADDVANVLTDR